MLSWLEEDPDASAVVLLERLQEAEPERLSRAHLYGRCNGECRNGEASCPASWSTQGLGTLRETLATCRN